MLIASLNQFQAVLNAEVAPGTFFSLVSTKQNKECSRTKNKERKKSGNAKHAPFFSLPPTLEAWFHNQKRLGEGKRKGLE
jgi:hypothetical protein